MKFSSAEGATPFETIEALESALDAVFNYRAFGGSFLENPAILDLPQFPSVEGCSDETQEVGFDIIGKMTDIIFDSVKLGN